MKQHTVSRNYEFEGQGLHSGAFTRMTVKPAPDNHGIRFLRTDLGCDATVRALATNVCDVSLNTTLQENGVRVMLVEHILSALAGMGVDNALIELDNIEVPVIDGSALPFAAAIAADGLQEQQCERRYFEIPERFFWKDDRSDAWISLEPADNFEARLTIDFGSSVIGVQNCEFSDSDDYLTQIAPCRTFCFLSQIEQMAAAGLIKGGSMDNAIVIVDREVDRESIRRITTLFNVPDIEIRQGYLSNVDLHFSNECARHKMLDLIGDMSLLGRPLKAKVTAMKTGHRINTTVAAMLLKQYSQEDK